MAPPEELPVMTPSSSRIAWTLAAVALLAIALSLRLLFAPPAEASASDSAVVSAGVSAAELPDAAARVARPASPATPDQAGEGAPAAARPADVSDTEWQVLQGVAARSPDPAATLAHLLDKLRFSKWQEQFRSAGAAPGASAAGRAERAALAARLLDALPARVAAGDVSRDQALALQRECSAVLAPDPAAAAARARAEAARLPGRVLTPAP